MTIVNKEMLAGYVPYITPPLCDHLARMDEQEVKTLVKESGLPEDPNTVKCAQAAILGALQGCLLGLIPGMIIWVPGGIMWGAVLQTGVGGTIQNMINYSRTQKPRFFASAIPVIIGAVSAIPVIMGTVWKAKVEAKVEANKEFQWPTRSGDTNARLKRLNQKVADLQQQLRAATPDISPEQRVAQIQLRLAHAYFANTVIRVATHRANSSPMGG